MLPQLRKIEEQYAEDVIVIGVHSGKYIAERETSRILEASLRFGVTHPIVNDRQFRIWRAYAVRAWPTLAVIDRNGYVVGAHAGEFTSQMLAPLLTTLISMAPPSGMHSEASYPADEPAIRPMTLRYPQKIAVSSDRVAISDTGNSRVLIGKLENDSRMRIERVVTKWSGTPARAFSAPQGLVFDAEKLYVTDSALHTVSVTDLTNGETSLLAGTGQQMRTRGDRAEGALSSPWDITIVGQRLYVAMAGVHQIWTIDVKSGIAEIHSGAGGEDILDGEQATALLAQPMGITTDGNRLYFADSESSAIRWSDVPAGGRVETIVGTGLFDFGDVDGVGDRVRMQHQQALALHKSGELLVVDSYNDALKWVNVQRKEARTWLRGFHEPAGVSAAERVAYVADTNAHRIVVAEYSTGDVRELEIAS